MFFLVGIMSADRGSASDKTVFQPSSPVVVGTYQQDDSDTEAPPELPSSPPPPMPARISPDLQDVQVSKVHFPGLILGLCPANKRRRYFVTSLIGWAQT